MIILPTILILLVNVYYPTNSPLALDQRKFEEILGQTSATINNCRKKDEELLITGDFNVNYEKFLREPNNYYLKKVGELFHDNIVKGNFVFEKFGITKKQLINFIPFPPNLTDRGMINLSTIRSIISVYNGL